MSDPALHDVRSYLLSYLGDFRDSAHPSLDRFIRQRMGHLGIDSPGVYAELLRKQGEEFDRCISAVTIKETYFFREPAYLSLLTQRVIPDMLKRNQTVTILSAGCSTGAEPYSIAIALHEQYGQQILNRCRITGMDVDPEALRKARSGVYSPYTLRGMSDRRRGRYFTNRDDRFYQLIPEIRSTVSFQRVNLLDQGSMARLEPPDIILYRNVSIYFDMDRRIQVFSSLADRLSSGGVLVTGASETLAHDIGVLALAADEGLFYFTHHAGEGPAEPAEMTPVSQDLEPAMPALPDEKPFESVLKQALGGDFEEAWRMVERLQVRPDLGVSRDILKGGILYNLKRFDQAHDICSRILDADPMRMEAYLIRAMVHRLQGEVDRSLKELKKVLYLDPACWVSLYYSAELYHQLGEKRMARICFQRVIGIMEQGTRRDYLLVFPVNRIRSEQVVRLCRYALEKL